MSTSTLPVELESIAAFAFWGAQIESISLSENITNIGVGAFGCCSSLEYITIDENNPYYKSEDGVLYNKECTKILCMHKMLFECIQNLTLDLLSVFSDIETRKRAERQRTGLLAMKERGEWDKMGRPHACEWDKFTETFERVLQGALKPFDAIRELEISVPTYYRYKKQYEQEHSKAVVSS